METTLGYFDSIEEAVELDLAGEDPDGIHLAVLSMSRRGSGRDVPPLGVWMRPHRGPVDGQLTTPA